MAIGHFSKTPKLPTVLLILLLIPISTILLFLRPLSTTAASHRHLLLRRRLTAESHCDGTLYPALCISTLAAIPDLHKKTLSDAITATIAVTVREVEASESNCTGLERHRQRGYSALTLQQRRAIDDCVELLDDSADELQSAVADLEEANGAVAGRKYDDIRTMLSAAMTNQYTCLDGFEFGGSRKLRDQILKPQLTRISHHVSNALAMLKKAAHKSAATARMPAAAEQMIYGVRKDGFPR